MFRLDGKVALVSGAGRGMGFGIAQALAAQGAHVVVNDFHQDRAESATRQLCEAGLKASAQAAARPASDLRSSAMDFLPRFCAMRG